MEWAVTVITAPGLESGKNMYVSRVLGLLIGAASIPVFMARVYGLLRKDAFRFTGVGKDAFENQPWTKDYEEAGTTC